jgi:hypothetical protein
MIQMLRPSTYLHPFGIASQQSSSPTPQYRAPTSTSTRITTLPPNDQPQAISSIPRRVPVIVRVATCTQHMRYRLQRAATGLLIPGIVST